MQQTHQPRLSLNLASLSSDDFLSPTTLDSSLSLSLSERALQSADLYGSYATPTTSRPSKSPMHFRRKTYAGDLRLPTISAVHDYEERIALLESHNSRISVELEATRDTLIDEREERRIERQSLIMPSPSLLGSSSQTELDGHIQAQSEVLYERRLRMEILDTLKKVRTQNSTISRTVREYQDKCASLSSVLEVERNGKEELREDIKELTKRNFTLFEHNKLLVGRDSALQQEIGNLLTKSQADDWMRGVLEEELQRTRQNSPKLAGNSENHEVHAVTAHLEPRCGAPTITLEHQGPLRSQLVTARDELHVARRCLEASEKRCEELEERVCSLQQKMTQCLDSSAQALEVERDLRAEVEGHYRTLEEENRHLKDQINDLLEHKPQDSTVEPAQTPVDPVPLPYSKSTESSPKAFPAAQLPHQILCGEVQRISVDVRNITMSPAVDIDPHRVENEASLGMRRRERLLDRQLRLSSLKRINRRRSSLRASRSALFSSVASPQVSGASVFQSLFVAEIPATVTSEEDVPRTQSPTQTSIAFKTGVEDISRPQSPILESASARAEARAAKRHSSLRPLQLGSPKKLLEMKRVGIQASPTPVDPSPILRLPPAPPCTPLPLKPIGFRERHSFRSGASSAARIPGSPDSAVSTLVPSSPAPSLHDKKKSLMLLPATLSKIHSFEPTTLKSTTTLFLDMRNIRESALPTPSTDKSIRKESAQRKHPSQHLRRASAVLVNIAKSSGIGDLDEWFVV